MLQTKYSGKIYVRGHVYTGKIVLPIRPPPLQSIRTIGVAGDVGVWLQLAEVRWAGAGQEPS